MMSGQEKRRFAVTVYLDSGLHPVVVSDESHAYAFEGLRMGRGEFIDPITHMKPPEGVCRDMDAHFRGRYPSWLQLIRMYGPTAISEI